MKLRLSYKMIPTFVNVCRNVIIPKKMYYQVSKLWIYVTILRLTNNSIVYLTNNENVGF